MALDGGLHSNLMTWILQSDIAQISSTNQQIQEKTTKLEEEASRLGLKVNTEKTKVTGFNARNQDKIVIN